MKPVMAGLFYLLLVVAWSAQLMLHRLHRLALRQPGVHHATSCD